MGRHFTQVIFPDIGFQGSTGEWFAGHGHNAPILISSRITGSGNDKADLRTLLPKSPGKFVSEKESVVASPLGKEFDCVVKTAPRGVDCRLKPSAKREAVGAGLADDDAK